MGSLEYVMRYRQALLVTSDSPFCISSEKNIVQINNSNTEYNLVEI